MRAKVFSWEAPDRGTKEKEKEQEDDDEIITSYADGEIRGKRRARSPAQPLRCSGAVLITIRLGCALVEAVCAPASLSEIG